MKRTSRSVRRIVGACLAAALASCLVLVALASAQGGSGDPQAITVTANAGTATVTGADGLRPGPTRVTLRAAGRQEQELLVIRLKAGIEEADVARYVRRVDSVPVDLVSLESAFSVTPDTSVPTTVNLPPGRYIAAAGAQGVRGPGTYATFGVGGEPTGGSLPRADASIQMFDYGVRIPKRIGRDGTLRIENIGRNEHFIVGIRLDPGADPRVVRRQLVSGAGFQGPPPGEFVSIIGVVSPRTTNVFQANLRPGVYLLACFYADRASAGHEHSEFGMVKQVTVR